MSRSDADVARRPTTTTLFLWAPCFYRVLTCHVDRLSNTDADEFATTPEELWDTIQEVDEFQQWWSWLEEFHLDGDTLQAGSVLTGVVAPPLPYRMRIRVEIVHCEPPARIDAVIHGDLEGKGRLELGPATSAPVPRSSGPSK